MADKYILQDKTPVPEPDVIAWGKWFQTADRTVAKSRVGGVRISTVFLGLDHSYGVGGPPILFETMVFGGPLDGEMDRYTTWDDAEKGHAVILARAEAAHV